MPRAIGLSKASPSMSGCTGMPTAKKAKTGTAKPAVKGRQTCSYRSATDSVAPSRGTAGTVKARAAPVIVAWIPDEAPPTTTAPPR